MSIAIGRRMTRPEIARAFNMKYSRWTWLQGVISTPNHVLLLITLDKTALPERFRFKDGFLSRRLLKWESQAKDRPQSTRGRLYQEHSERDMQVIAFVRRANREGGRTLPFCHIGPVEFRYCHGERPMSVIWELETPLPSDLATEFQLAERHVPERS